MLKFKNESKRLRIEFNSEIDPRLKAVLLELTSYAWQKHAGHIVLTCLNRTPDENKAVNGVAWSAHLYGRAVDIRTRIFPIDVITDLQEHLESVWGTDFLFVKYHDAGSGNHLHVNINYKHRR